MCTLEKRGRVLILTLTGSGEHRLDPSMIASLRSALATVRSDPSAAALVVTNEGRFFCNGFDSKAKLTILVSLAKELVADLVSLPIPTIAAITGHVEAAGVMIALAHDYIYMACDRGDLYCSELDVGLPFPPYYMVLLRTKLTKPGTLRDKALRAKKMNAIEGKERGIVDEGFKSASDAVAEAVNLAEKLAARNWDRGVYASIRMCMYPELCMSVGLPQETDDEVANHFVSKL